MKHKKIFVILASCCLTALSSCSGFLTERPETSMMSSNAYESESDLESHVRGIIAAFHNGEMQVGNMGENLQSSSGLIHFARVAALTDVRWQCLLKLTESSMTINTSMYTGHYTGINRCNVLLEGLESSPVSEAYKREIAAEAKFYRAVFYFSLVRLYGDVPLILQRVTSDELGHSRTNYCEVYAQIVSDFKDAWEGMRDSNRVREVSGSQGRPDKWAAKAMLSSVYLQIALILHVPENDNFYDASKEGRTPYFDFDGIGADESAAWRLAYDTAKDVIDNGPYALAAKYSDLFQWDGSFVSEDGHGAWDSPERIFVVQSNGAASFLLAKRSLPRYPEGASVQQGSYHNRFGNWRPTRFFFQKWAAVYPGGTRNISVHQTIGGDAINIDETIYTGSSDPRFAISMFYNSYKRCNDGGTQYIYPEINSIIGRKSSNGQYVRFNDTNVQIQMYPYFRKYNSPTFNGQDNGVADFYYMRLAELYYIAAEAAVRLGNEDEAYDLVEVVHARARKSSPTGTEAAQPKWTRGAMSGDQLVNAIVWDKLFELCGEGHEFFETHGRGAAWFSEQVVGPLNEELRRPSNRFLVYKLYSRDTVNIFQFPSEPSDLRKSLLCQFPLEEIAYNPALTSADQNDYCWW